MKPLTNPVKFLLVDDREENLVGLEALLRREGLELLTARSGTEALELLLVHEVALALLDVQMPDMDGFELAELMRGADRSRHIPIIFITADTQEKGRIFQGYDAGAVDFLFKPIDPRILRHKTETFFQLHKQRQELEDTLRLNETFMAAVGHDLKNPLSAIVMATELILSSTKEASTLKTGERLRSSSRRMQRIIDDLFDLARVRLGAGIPIEVREVDAVVVARRVIAEIEAAHAAASIVLTHDGNSVGIWDGGRLGQIVSNLVGNAVRHGAAKGTVHVDVVGHDETVVVSVHNEGTIPPELLPHLFDPFRSSEDRRARAEGLGLGLYIVKQLVLAHGGEIEVTSTEAQGTTFEIRFPRISVVPT